MLMRVRYSSSLALLIAHFGGVVTDSDFHQLRALLMSEEGPAQAVDQMFLFDAAPHFEASARRAFRAHLESLSNADQLPLAISCAVVCEDNASYGAMRTWLECAASGVQSRAAVDMFNSWRDAAAWIGLDERGVDDVRQMREFETLFDARL